MIRSFLILAYYTDLDLSAYDSAQGRYELYDVIATHDLWKPIMEIVERDFDDVMDTSWVWISPESSLLH